MSDSTARPNLYDEPRAKTLKPIQSCCHIHSSDSDLDLSDDELDTLEKAKLLAEKEMAESLEVAAQADGTQKGVFGMKFMQKALEKKREEASAQAAALLEELEQAKDAENGKKSGLKRYDGEDDASSGDDATTAAKKKQSAGSSDEDDSDSDADCGFSAAQLAAAARKMRGEAKKGAQTGKESSSEEEIEDDSSSEEEEAIPKAKAPAAAEKSKSKKAAEEEAAAKADAAANPWLAAGMDWDAPKSDSEEEKASTASANDADSGSESESEATESGGEERRELPALGPAKKPPSSASKKRKLQAHDGASEDPVAKRTRKLSKPAQDSEADTAAGTGEASSDDGADSDSDDEEARKAVESDNADSDSDDDGGLFHTADGSGVNAEERRKQAERVESAFAGDGLSFQRDFEDEIEKKIRKKEEEEEEAANAMAGWGSWTGQGVAKKSKKKLDAETAEAERRKAAKNTLGISAEKGNKAAKVQETESADNTYLDKYTVGSFPHPYKSKEQYESTLAAPVGSEWNSQEVTKHKIAPKIVTRLGAVVKPLAYAKHMGSVRERSELLDAWTKKSKRGPQRAGAKF